MNLRVVDLSTGVEREPTPEEVSAWEQEVINTPVVAVNYSLPISTFWMRMTDDEAEEFDDAISSAPLRQRKAFNAATVLVSNTDLFAYVKGLLVGLADQARADEIMADPATSLTLDEVAQEV